MKSRCEVRLGPAAPEFQPGRGRGIPAGGGRVRSPLLEKLLYRSRAPSRDWRLVGGHLRELFLRRPISIVRLALSIYRPIPVRSFRVRIICELFIQAS